MLKLTQREKRLLQFLAIILGGSLLYLFIIAPYLEFRRTAENQAARNARDLAKLEDLYEEYKEIRQKKTRYMSMLGNKNENITTMIEQWSTASDVARHISYTRRTQSVVQNKYLRVTTDVKIEGVPIQKLLRFLYEIESSNVLLKISYLRIYQGLKGADTYDVILKIDSFSLQ